MSSTVLRLGLWILVLVLAVYVIRETNAEEPFAEIIPDAMLTQALALSGLLVVAGLGLRLFEKGAKAVSKNRCAVCKTPIPHGAIYCRAHLRTILHEEDEKTHMTRVRR